MLSLIIVVIIGVSLYFIASKGILSSSTTSTFTTTVVQGNITSFSSCTGIAKSGTYYLTANVKTAATDGACVNVTASNVDIICNSYQIIGSGPFVGVPPFSYALMISNASNVSVNGCIFKNFSYGIFATSTNSLRLTNDNLSVNYVSNIYLSNVHNGTLSNDYMSKSSSVDGSLYLTNGTSGVLTVNSSVQYNQYYGVVVNASNNTFRNNLVNGTQYSFSCSAPNGFVVSNKAYLNLCYNNTGCGFVQCRGINIPANISKITLSSKLNSCGTISDSGYYSMSSNLNMGSFVNTSNPLSILNPCINVKAKNVVINCNGFSILGATTAIYVNSKSNVTVMNCKLENALVDGIMLDNVTQAHISNLTLVNDSLGLQLYNSSISTFTNISASRNLYGLYLSGSYANNFQGLNFSLNNYGVFLQSDSLSNNFNKDIILNSSSVDVYATPDSANATLNLMQSTTCNLTNAVWATCRHFVYTSLSYVPISSCGAIGAPGNYLLTTSLLNVQSQCLQILANNVQLSCGGHTIASGEVDVGAGISFSNLKNITISNCSISLFKDAVNVTNSTVVNLDGLNVQGGTIGVRLGRVLYGSVANSQFNGTMNASILLSNTRSIDVINNTATDGLMQSVGIFTNSSYNNTILNNSAISEYIGMEFNGGSLNNTVQNNTVSGSTYTDFLCSQNAGALSAALGGINYGSTKTGCRWLAALPKFNPSVECSLSAAPNFIEFTQDSEYTYGSTCLTVYSNATTIDCDGHTIIAQNGGTFAAFMNSKGSELENCYLKGFTTPVVSVNSSLNIFNNSVYLSPKNSGFAINLSNMESGTIVRTNNISGAGAFGIRISNSTSGSLLNNFVANAAIAYLLQNVSGFGVTNNTAYTNTSGGLLLVGSTGNPFRSNRFLSRTLGLQCEGSSGGASNNSDLGQNECSSVLNCNWMKSPSSSTC